jgi:predicted dehydrogenase
MNPLKIAVVGCGSRGRTYATYALENPHLLKVVAIAEPDPHRRQAMAAQHGLHWESSAVVGDWMDWSSETINGFEAVIISTLDHLHEAPAIHFAGLGKHLLLEKPMAPTLDACERIAQAIRDAGVMMAVCHVYRYTPYTRMIRQLIDAGAIGDIQTVQHLEPVGWWHYAHSFVRGNWRNEKASSFMLMSKSCHDMDWLDSIMGGPPDSVFSTGSLRHFTHANRPAEAADRCTDCRLAETCPYSATAWYLNALKRGETGWPVDVVTSDISPSGVLAALKTGPYGRCVYASDNDVVDTQHVLGMYRDGRSFNFTMTAFTADGGRKSRIFGDKGMLEYDGVEPIRTTEKTDWKPATLRLLDFSTSEWSLIDIHPETPDSQLAGHGFGDFYLMQAWTEAIRSKKPDLLLSDAETSLRSHRTVFRAEESRHAGLPLDLNP